MAKKCGRGEILREGYETRRGVTVAPTCIRDRGKKGKGPKTLPAATPGNLKGWQKDLPQSQRMKSLKSVVKADGCATTIRRLNWLRNKTDDVPTKKAAEADMNKLRKQSYCKLKTKS